MNEFMANFEFRQKNQFEGHQRVKHNVSKIVDKLILFNGTPRWRQQSQSGTILFEALEQVELFFENPLSSVATVRFGFNAKCDGRIKSIVSYAEPRG